MYKIKKLIAWLILIIIIGGLISIAAYYEPIAISIIIGVIVLAALFSWAVENI